MYLLGLFFFFFFKFWFRTFWYNVGTQLVCFHTGDLNNVGGSGGAPVAHLERIHGHTHTGETHVLFSVGSCHSTLSHTLFPVYIK